MDRYDSCDEYVEYYKHLMFILESKQKELPRDNASQDSIMSFTIGGAVVGGLLGGGGGALVGAVLGYMYGSFIQDSFKEIKGKLRNQTNSRKRELVHAVQALIGSNSKAELDLYVEARSQQKQLMDCIMKFT
ncbi:hypothetical protein MAR_030477 [Mya arenaria]|uniref:Uncharacterized protein n=1 Tax=Mya arenaria TaxID=6604 RepID=A0ABY7F126_MYAAR|nr:uncharacterized protein LOC128206210 [Mya arenaria]WAR15883.1 hypothetical protein MAR_030477 [Mya arenaria]